MTFAEKHRPTPQNLWSTDCDRVHLEQSLSRHGVKPGFFLVGNISISELHPVEKFSQKNLPRKNPLVGCWPKWWSLILGLPTVFGQAICVVEIFAGWGRKCRTWASLGMPMIASPIQAENICTKIFCSKSYGFVRVFFFVFGIDMYPHLKMHCCISYWTWVFFTAMVSFGECIDQEWFG